MDGAAGDATDVKVHTDLAITGKPAQFGRGVMQDVSDKLLGQFVDCLEQRLQARGRRVAAGRAAEAAAGAGARRAAAAAASRAGAVPPPPPPAAPT